MCLAASTITVAGCVANLPEAPVTIGPVGSSSQAGAVTGTTSEEAPFQASVLEFEVLHKANYNPFELDNGKSFKTVQTEADYRAELVRHSIEVTKPVDFATSQVLVSSAGEKPIGGYSVSVTKVEEFEDSVVATVVQTVPGPSCVTTQGITHPYEFVTVPTTKPIEIFERQTVDAC